MKAIIFTAVVTATAALAASGWYFLTHYGREVTPQVGTSAEFDTSLATEDRIAALERAVSDERQARQLLQEEVFYLTSELELLSGTPASPVREGEPEALAAEDSGESRRAESRRRNSREGRIERLVDAGFLPGQADWIMQREQELQMEALQARFDAEKSGEPLDWMGNRNSASDKLREELGDADYERYLEANNRSTNVAVSSVIESSPAQVAGLQPGDEIYRYDGQRVFSMTDLTRQTMAGEPGQNVAVDVMRNGNLIQVVMPRGPVGITGGRRRY